MSGAPFFYDYSNREISSLQPGSIHCADNELQNFFKRYLLQRALSVFEWELPKTWEKNYFLYVLFVRGFIAIINTDKFGVIPQGCGLYGYNVMYQPTNCTIANPLLSGNLRPRIGKDCTVIRLQPDWGGIYDLVCHYANLLACASEANAVNLMNSKFSYVFFAANKAEAETFKKLYDSFSSGHPAVVIDKKLLNENGEPNWQLFTQNVSQNYIVDRNMIVFRRLQEMFDTEIGIPNINQDKKERLVVDEVNANNVETYSNASLWLDELKKGCEQANKMFGINMSVKLRDFSKIMQAVEGGETDANLDNGSLRMG